MLITLEDRVLEKYPEAEIGYLVAQVEVHKNAPFVEELKSTLAAHLQKMGINATNFAVHPSIAAWREVYEKDFQVKAKSYRSSIESLLRRVVTGKGIWNISSVVDLYNCCSIFSLLPMGGYDLQKISGDITIRYARAGEQFLPLGEREKVVVEPHQIVYADTQRLLCWLWNHKDCAETSIGMETQQVLFFMDALEPHKVVGALDQLAFYLEKIHCQPLIRGVLNSGVPQATIC